ncbi:MAG: hypothetical protein JRI53_11955 [Deltaproteobacteria bacterium]|nr:hypothetical protein [Deltaproteobacteria bacterium]
MPNFCVPAERDLRYASISLNINPPPPFGGLILEILLVWVPDPIRFFGSTKIIAFLELEQTPLSQGWKYQEKII